MLLCGAAAQDDVLYETLTVHETLLYAGLLRLPRSMSTEDKRARVDGVIQVIVISTARSELDRCIALQVIASDQLPP